MIQQERDLQKEKDEAIQQAKAAKKKAKLYRQQETEEKQRITEDIKRMKALERQIRLQEAEKKKLEKEQQCCHIPYAWLAG
jgi:hypothetical protein